MLKKTIFSLACLTLCISHTQDNTEQLLQKLATAKVHFVNFLFSDLLGHIKEVCVPIDHAESALNDGIYFDGSSVPGCSKINQSDMILKPDINTVRIIPWLEGTNKTAIIFCDIWQDRHTPFAGDPRGLLKRSILEAQELGYTLNVGPEIEFFILKEDNSPTDTLAYFNAQTDAKRIIQNNSLLHLLKNIGINVEKFHHEVAVGQYEFSIKYGQPLEIADQVLLAKYTLNNVLNEFGYKATFMPKPFAHQNGSAMHIHFSLWDNTSQKNAFYSNADAQQLSTIGKQFIAGILHHMPAITAIFNPTVNSYKRLVPGYEAPVYICWGTKNRSALIRLPEVHSPNGVRGELRCPDPLCNPYLAFNAILKAGIIGIINEYTPPHPIEKNLYKMSIEERKKTLVTSLPSSLEGALKLFKESEFTHKVFGKQLIHNFAALKEKEIHAYNIHVSEWERETYR